MRVSWLPNDGSSIVRLIISVVLSTVGDVFLSPRRVLVMLLGKLTLQIPRKRNNLGNRTIQLLRNTLP